MTTIAIDHLRHFVSTVENQGVIKAAEKLFISASSITRSIHLVEESVGEPLFDRVGRRLRLNAAGRAFYQRAEKLLKNYTELWSKPDTVETELLGHYLIGASHFLCTTVLADEIAKLTARFSRASFEVRSFDTNELVRRIHRGDIDCGLAFSPKVPERVSERRVATGELLLCAGKRSRLVGRPFAEIRPMLHKSPAIMHRPADSVERCDNHPMFRSHRIRPRIQIYWDSDSFALEVLAAGDTWSMLPDRVIRSDSRVVSLAHPRGWKAPYHISLVWNQAKAHSPLVEALSEIKI